MIESKNNVSSIDSPARKSEVNPKGDTSKLSKDDLSKFFSGDLSIKI